MSKNKKSELPPPLTEKSSRGEMWEEILCMREEINKQQDEVLSVRDAMKAKNEELTKLREMLASAHLRLNIIKVALSNVEY